MRTVLVTGGSGGIGQAVLRNLADAGFNQIATSHTAKGAATIEGLGLPRVHVIRLDLRDPDTIANFARAAPALWGVVNNAGVCVTQRLAEQSTRDPWDEVLAVNLRGPELLTRAILPKLSRPGRIVNVASQLGHEGRAGYGAYCAAKFGLIGLTKCWAKELGTDGVTCNAVSPGWVDTQMTRSDLQHRADQLHTTFAALTALATAPLELQRMTRATEVAAVIAFLLSDAASGITGQAWLMQSPSHV